MKTKQFLFAALATITLAGCSMDEFMGDNSPTVAEENTEASSINFGFELPNVTRADLVGVDAATKLQNQFVVFGTKHVSAEAADASKDEVVFQNYVVEYTTGTAGTTASNTHNWEYVGKTPYDASIVSPAITGTQAIKYWDLSAENGYTFYAFASKADLIHKDGSSNPDPLVTVTKTTSGTTVYDKGYSMVIKNGADLDKLFVADRKPVAKTAYKEPVTLTFRNFGTRVRVGFYETIPGYSVTINKFYYADGVSAAVTTFGAMDDANTTNFAASLQNINTSAASNTIAVSYYDNTVTDIENHVKLTPTTVDYNYTLTLGTGVVGTELSVSAATPTWDLTGGAYTTVYPFEGNTNPMLLKVDFTLTAEDVSTGAETIEVKGANVVVPTQYVQWKSNFAYTYLFKISPETNGNTGTIGTDEEGLFPITFDAVVVEVADDKTQETITSFGNYSITTYANGSKVTTNDEYKTGEDIYVVKMNNATNAVVAPSAIGNHAGEAQVYTVTSSAGEVINEATVMASLTGSPNGITLTALTGSGAASLQQYAPAADGTQFDFGTRGAVKFTPSTAGSYVYVSTQTAYVAPAYTAAGSTYDDTKTYYFKNTANGVDYYYAAEGINSGNFANYSANLYTQSNAGTAGVYDIKVIKVQ